VGEQKDDWRELVWILWTVVTVQFLVFGVIELVGSQHAISFWLIAGLLGASCSVAALILGSRDGDTLAPAMESAEPENSRKTSFQASDDTKGVVVDAALVLAETQLLAQVAEDANIDGRTTGLLGFSGALVAATIAAKEPIGFFWFAPLVVLGLVTFAFLWILYGGTKLRHLLTDLLHPPNRMGFGVPAGKFYENFAGTSPLKAREDLLKELAKVVEENAARIRRQQRRLQVATIAMIVGLVVAGLLIAFDRPTKMEPCSEKSPQCHRTAPPGSKKSAPVAQSPKTRPN
jgi:hypothetical protein